MLMTEPEPPPDGADTAAGDTSNVYATWVAVTADALLPDGWVVREKTSKDGKRKSKSYRFGATGKIHASLRSAKDAAAGLLEAGPAINAIDGAAVADPVPDDSDAPAKKRRKAAAAAAAAAAAPSSDAPQRPPEQSQLARAVAAATSTAAAEADRARAAAQVTMSHVADNPPSLNRAHH